MQIYPFPCKKRILITKVVKNPQLQGKGIQVFFMRNTKKYYLLIKHILYR